MIFGGGPCSQSIRHLTLVTDWGAGEYEATEEKVKNEEQKKLTNVSFALTHTYVQ